MWQIVPWILRSVKLQEWQISREISHRIIQDRKSEAYFMYPLEFHSIFHWWFWSFLILFRFMVFYLKLVHMRTCNQYPHTHRVNYEKNPPAGTDIAPTLTSRHVSLRIRSHRLFLAPISWPTSMLHMYFILWLEDKIQTKNMLETYRN